MGIGFLTCSPAGIMVDADCGKVGGRRRKMRRGHLMRYESQHAGGGGLSTGCRIRGY